MIRPYTKHDKQKILDIFKLNIPKYFDHSEFADLENYLEKESKTYRVIEVNGFLVGGFGYIIDKEKSEGSITWIFFNPDNTGKGFGKLALNYCHDLFKNTGGIKTYTVRTSQLAYRFFEKFGYKTINKEKDYWGDGLDLYAMKKDD